MRIGIIGLPNSGKTTLFNALTGATLPTGAGTGGGLHVETRTINVPDARVDRLSALYKPKRTVYATVTYADIGGLDKGITEGGLSGPFRNELAQLDGFVHVVRAFDSEVVPHPYTTVDPARDLALLEGEFLLTDLVMVENRVSKLNDELRIKGKKAEPVVLPELERMAQLSAALENETPLRDLGMDAEAVRALRGFGFLTLKPVLVVLNCGETLTDPATALPGYAEAHQATRVVAIHGALEAEIAQLDAADAAMFMDEYDIHERSADAVVRLSYELLAVQSFFTVGPDEVRAWRTAVGATAPEAAGAIHSDLQRGFIRAEVMTTGDLLGVGSEAAVKQAGKMRLEGKEYVVQDGDILNIRHSS